MSKLLLPLVGLCALSVAFAYSEYRENLNLKQEFQDTKARLEEEARILKAKLAEPDRKIPEPEVIGVPAEKPRAEPTAAPSVNSASSTVVSTVVSTLPKNEWRAGYLLRQIEEHLALSPDETEELRNKFKSGGGLAELAGVVGPERAQKFQAKQEERAREEEEEEAKDKVFRLSRELALTNEQERRVEEVVRTVRKTLQPVYENLKVQSNRAMELHTAPEGGDELRALYESYRVNLDSARDQENRLLNKELVGTLSDDQLNKLIELQAKERGL